MYILQHWIHMLEMFILRGKWETYVISALIYILKIEAQLKYMLKFGNFSFKFDSLFVFVFYNNLYIGDIDSKFCCFEIK